MSALAAYLKAKADYPEASRITVRGDESYWVVRIYESYTHDELELIAKHRIPMYGNG